MNRGAFIFVCSMLLALYLSAVAAQTWTALHPARDQSSKTVPRKTCFNDLIPIHDVTPTFSADMVPWMLSKVKLDTALGIVDHVACGQKQQQQKHAWPYPADPRQSITLRQHSMDKWPVLSSSCSNIIPGLSIVITRKGPLQHFGHRMLSELPALYALKLYLESIGVDLSHVRVIYTDGLGHPAWGPENFKPILLSLGYKSYEPAASSMVCFDQVIFMPVMFYPKWYTTSQGQRVNMWQAPEELYDANPFHLSMIGHIRKHAFGLSEQLPFAPAVNRTIVLASRSARTRARLGFRASRLLLNEDELFEALQKLSNTNVIRVEMGAENITNIVTLLERTSLFLGYHGAAFDNLVFLPRGAFVLEILPMGTNHAPLYPALAHRTGKEFARCVNDDPKRQGGQHHWANLTVDVKAVMKLVESILQTQEAALRRYEFDANVR